MEQVSLNVNGKSHTVDTDPTTPLLYVLRDDLELNGPRFGCGLSQCGACTVIMDGKTVRSCSIAVSAAQNRKITTLEGLGTVQHPHYIQTAFIEEQAAQCGYCMNSMIMTAKVFLDQNPEPHRARNPARAERQSLPLRKSPAGDPRGTASRPGKSLRVTRSLKENR